MTRLPSNIPFNIKNYVREAVVAGITLLMVLLMLGSTNFLYSSYKESKDKEQKTKEMNEYLDGWQQKVARLNTSELRAVTVKDLDDIQATLLYNLQLNNLQLTSFRSLNPQKKGDKEQPQNKQQQSEAQEKKANEKKEKQKLQDAKHDYEIICEGQYGSVMKYISEFKAKNALINIQNLELDAKDDKIIAKIKYRVYTID